MQGPGRINGLGKKDVPCAQFMLHYLTLSLPDRWQDTLLQPVIRNLPENEKRLKFPENKITNQHICSKVQYPFLQKLAS